MDKPKISIVLPCRDEEKALKELLPKLKSIVHENNLDAEIILSDSSSDNSPEIAKGQGIKVHKHDKKGYGIAYLEGFSQAKGDYIVMLDADCTYPVEDIPKFVKELEKGNDLVIGNRFSNGINKNSMPFLHRKIGNPLLSNTLKLFFGKGVNDAHCGMRAIRKDALEKLNLQTTGMEFASEMVMKSLKNKLKISEIPIDYRERKGRSKLSTFKDGWRHLRFMLLYSPLYLFLFPGAILLILGILSMIWFYSTNPQIGGVQLFFQPMFISSLLMITGYQLIIFAGFSKTYAITHLGEEDEKFEKLYKYLTIERASIIGFIAVIGGLALFAIMFVNWVNSGFSFGGEIKNSIAALTIMVMGIQTIFSSFMLSILSIKEK